MNGQQRVQFSGLYPTELPEHGFTVSPVQTPGIYPEPPRVYTPVPTPAPKVQKETSQSRVPFFPVPTANGPIAAVARAVTVDAFLSLPEEGFSVGTQQQTVVPFVNVQASAVPPPVPTTYMQSKTQHTSTRTLSPSSSASPSSSPSPSQIEAITVLQKRVEDRERDVQNYKQHLEQVSEALEESKNKVDSLQIVLRELQTERSTYRAEISSLRQQVQELMTASLACNAFDFNYNAEDGGAEESKGNDAFVLYAPPHAGPVAGIQGIVHQSGAYVDDGFNYNDDVDVFVDEKEKDYEYDDDCHHDAVADDTGGDEEEDIIDEAAGGDEEDEGVCDGEDIGDDDAESFDGEEDFGDKDKESFDDEEDFGDKDKESFDDEEDIGDDDAESSDVEEDFGNEDKDETGDGCSEHEDTEAHDDGQQDVGEVVNVLHVTEPQGTRRVSFTSPRKTVVAPRGDEKGEGLAAAAARVRAMSQRDLLRLTVPEITSLLHSLNKAYCKPKAAAIELLRAAADAEA